VAFAFAVFSPVEIAIMPVKLAKAVIKTIFEPSFKGGTSLKRSLSLSIKLSSLKLSLVGESLLLSESSPTVEKIFQEMSMIRRLLSRQSTFDSFSITVGALKYDSVAPVLSWPLEYSCLEVAHQTLIVGNDGSLSMGQVVLVVPEIVEAASVVLSVPLAFGAA
jgi:hypothetical protein